MKTFIICYVSEGMNLEENTWYAVQAEDRVQAYGKLRDYLIAEEEGEEHSYSGMTVEYFNEVHEVMFEFEGELKAHTKGLTVEEVK